MGLFDYLKFECDLPPEMIQEDGNYQTKDTPAQYMEKYTVTADGRIIYHAVEREFVLDEDAPLGVRLNKTAEHDEEWPYHGDLRLSSTGHRLRFTEGRLVAF